MCARDAVNEVVKGALQPSSASLNHKQGVAPKSSWPERARPMRRDLDGGSGQARGEGIRRNPQQSSNGGYEAKAVKRWRV